VISLGFGFYPLRISSHCPAVNYADCPTGFGRHAGGWRIQSEWSGGCLKFSAARRSRKITATGFMPF
ncbi:MAG: hypothetical protein LBU23_03120, partial [Planctomycetota bacterium]|nr:hypothetical protein [Planctomycetota bacterium]